MSNHPVLSLLGLALRGSHLVLGEEPVEGVVRAKDARVLLLAKDAADNTFRRCRHFAEVGQCLWVTLPFTKEEIGSAVGRSAVAIAAITDVGLAHAVVQKLANEDPKRYGQSAERLALKVQRAAERRAEQKAHEKNVRTGKYHGKQPAPKQEEQPKKQARREEAPKKPDAPRKRPASRPSKENRPKPKATSNRFAHSRPVKKGKGSFRKKED